MAGGSLLALLDDITTVLDDVAILSKVAARKTAAVVGDDLAVNANQVTGVDPGRELPVVWSVARGSFVNKAILVPAALLISAVAPWAITPLLMLGGLFLCYEAAEKLAHKFLHSRQGADAAHRAGLAQALASPDVDLVAFERDKIKGAIRTDFILSAEIIAIALGTVATAPFATRAGVLVFIAIAITVVVYGLVAAIVKLDDLGLALMQREGKAAMRRMARALGRGILRAAPVLMKILSVAGTVAMFLVGGGILVHGFHVLAAGIEAIGSATAAMPGIGAVLGAVVPMIANLLVGVAAGLVVLAAMTGIQRVMRARRSAAA